MNHQVRKTDIQWLWVQMARIFGAAAWRNEHGVSDDGVWLDELSSFNKNDLERGLANLRQFILAEEKRAYPIMAIEFHKHCIPSAYELGLPSEEVAYRLACRSTWDVHPIVYLAVGNIGTHNLRVWSEDKTRPWYGRNYRKLVAKVRAGHRLYIPAKRSHLLEKDDSENGESVITVPAKARDYISVLKKILNG